MSKVAIQGNASGTGTFTIQSPATNTDRVLSLPDEAGTVLTSGTPLSSFPTGFANGITMADVWRTTTDVGIYSGDASVVLRPALVTWSNVTTPIGSSMAVNSDGEWTFPETGIYEIDVHLVWYNNTNQGVRYIQSYVQRSTNSGLSWSSLTVSLAHHQYEQTDTTYNTQVWKNIFDCTNTSTDRMRIIASTGASSNIFLQGSTSENRSCVHFKRIGDT